jgi:hypothetical protein
MLSFVTPINISAWSAICLIKVVCLLKLLSSSSPALAQTLPCLDSSKECVELLTERAIALSSKLKTLDERIALIDERLELMGERKDYAESRLLTNYLPTSGVGSSVFDSYSF